MSAKSFTKKVEQAIEAVLEGEGYELVLAEFALKTHVLRLYIDRLHRDAQGEEGDPKGVTLDDCTKVSHVVSDLLDGEGLTDSVDGHFTLEVSSPGLDRPLVRPAHFERFVGQKVQVTTKEPPLAGSGRRKFSGALLSAASGGIRIDIDGTACDIGYEQIERARLVPQF